MTERIKVLQNLKITLTKNGGKQSILGRDTRFRIQSFAKAWRRRRYGGRKA